MVLMCTMYLIVNKMYSSSFKMSVNEGFFEYHSLPLSSVEFFEPLESYLSNSEASMANRASHAPYSRIVKPQRQNVCIDH